MTRNEFRTWVIVFAIAFTVLFIMFRPVKAETVKKFEISGVLEKGEFVDNKPLDVWRMGDAYHLLLISSDSSIQSHLNKMVGSRVRILVYEEVK